MTDYPDWQSFPSAQSDNIATVLDPPLAPGLHSTPVVPVTSWSSVTLIAQPTAGAGVVKINHFADAAATQLVGSDSWPINVAAHLAVRTPLRGKFIRIDVNVTSAVDMDCLFWASLMSAASDRISFPVGHQGSSDFTHALAANATATYNNGAIVGGNAFFYFKPYDTTGKLYVYIATINELGVKTGACADFATPTDTIREQIYVPDQITQVWVVNTDAAAAHTYDFNLVIPPQ